MLFLSITLVSPLLVLIVHIKVKLLPVTLGFIVTLSPMLTACGERYR